MQKKNAAKAKRRGSAELLSSSAGAEMLKRLRQKRQLLRKGATVDLGEMPTREAKVPSLKPEVQLTAL